MRRFTVVFDHAITLDAVSEEHAIEKAFSYLKRARKDRGFHIFEVCVDFEEKKAKKRA